MNSIVGKLLSVILDCFGKKIYKKIDLKNTEYIVSLSDAQVFRQVVYVSFIVQLRVYIQIFALVGRTSRRQVSPYKSEYCICIYCILMSICSIKYLYHDQKTIPF